MPRKFGALCPRDACLAIPYETILNTNEMKTMYEGIIVAVAVFIALGFISYIGAKYTVKYDRPDALIAIYVVFLAIAQFFATRLALFDFGVIAFIAPCGIVVFPFTLQLTDMVNEKYGRHEVYRMIGIAFVSQIMLVVFLQIATIATHIETYPGQSDPLTAFALVPSITIASWIAFLISENFDAWLYDKIRGYIANHLWIRNVFSDVLSLGLDSIIFTPLAFYVLPSIILGADTHLITPLDVLGTIMVGQLVMKWILGLIDTPFMYLTRWVYDQG